MPMYTQFCAQCGTSKIYLSSIAERDEQSCFDCETPMKRQIDIPGMVWAPTASTGATHR